MSKFDNDIERLEYVIECVNDLADADGDAMFRDHVVATIEEVKENLEEDKELPIWVVAVDNRTGFQGLSNVTVLRAENEREAINTAKENDVSYGRYKAVRPEKKLDSQMQDRWSYYR